MTSTGVEVTDCRHPPRGARHEPADHTGPQPWPDGTVQSTGSLRSFGQRLLTRGGGAPAGTGDPCRRAGRRRCPGRLSPSFEEQVGQALDNLQTALGSAQASLADVARLRILVVDHDEDRLGIIAHQVRRRWPNRAVPTCTLIPVPRLALDGMLFEIEAEAYAA